MKTHESGVEDSKPWDWQYTRYARDAGGNVMATYNLTYDYAHRCSIPGESAKWAQITVDGTLILKEGSYEALVAAHGGLVAEIQLSERWVIPYTERLAEHDIYGSSRIGLRKGDPLADTLHGASFFVALDADALSVINALCHFTKRPAPVNVIHFLEITVAPDGWPCNPWPADEHGDPRRSDPSGMTTNCMEKLAWPSSGYSNMDLTNQMTDYDNSGNTTVTPPADSHADPSLCKGKFLKRTLGWKQYELTDHLGNVAVTVSDRKLAHDDYTLTAGTGDWKYDATYEFSLTDGSGAGYALSTGQDGITDYYTADVISANEYYPFGMVMPGRNYSSPEYRYGFNGQEKDDEVKGSGNSLEFKLRIYDPRLSRFLSTDPFVNKYPFYTPYQFAGNSPLKFKDLEGGEPQDFVQNWNISKTGLTKWNQNVIQVLDKTTAQTWSVMQRPNSSQYYYLTSEMESKKGENRDWFDGDRTNKTNGHWNVMWVGFQPNSAVDASNKAVDALERAIVTPLYAAILGPAALASGLFGISTEMWAVKGAVSATVQLGMRGNIDIPDLVGDATLAPGSSALLGAAIDLSYTNGSMNLSFAGGDNKTLSQGGKEFANSLGWGMLGKGMGNTTGAIIEQIGSPAGTIMHEMVMSSVGCAAEQGVEKNAISPDGK